MADETQTVPATPVSVSDILADLKGFGIEDFEDVITMKSGAKQVQLKIANIPTDTELIAHLAVEGFKGYAWIQEVKCEILSRAISWINGVHIHSLTDDQRRVVDPADGQQKDIQAVLRGLIKGWGQEYMQVLWKVLMVHSQTIEDRLLESFPDAATMTEVERRLTERARAEIEATTQEVIVGQVSSLFEDETPAGDAPVSE